MTETSQNKSGKVKRGSCRGCKTARKNNNGILVSWRDAEVLVVGCKKHVKEVVDSFSESQQAKVKFLKVAEDG